MIKGYLHRVHQRPPHERRTHAMQIAAGFTGFALLVWVTTLGLRFAAPAGSQAQDSNQVASVAAAQDGSNATLLVATSSDSTYFNQQ